MFASVARRALSAVLLLLAVVVLNFTFIHLAPGDPVQVIVGEMGGATPEYIEETRRAYGLDAPVAVQLARYVANVAQGDLGYSIYFQRPVLELILSRLGPTLLLLTTALSVALAFGIALGAAAAVRPRGWISTLVSLTTLVGYAAPSFWTALVLLDIFAVRLAWLPSFGMATLEPSAPYDARLVDIGRHLALPAGSLAIVYVGIYSRYVRSSLLEVLSLDFIRTARAKGASELSILLFHGLRNALLPIITLVGMQAGQLLAGSVLMESVFNWPGLGSLVFQSILRRDHMVVLGVLLLSAVLVIAVNILTDVVYALADPRIRLSRAGGR